MILIIEDCKFTRSILMETLANGGYDVIGHANTGKEGIDLALEYEPDIITLDYMLPDMTGLEILKSIRASLQKTKIILISAIHDPASLEECKKLGIGDILTKPVKPNILKLAIAKAYDSIKPEGGKVVSMINR